MKSNKNQKRRPPLVVMAKLIVLIKPLLPVMLLAIVLGGSGIFVCGELNSFVLASLRGLDETIQYVYGKK